jgi:asparagine synthase (glutamine-hydrolysing)
MCGIAGIWQLDGQRVERSTIGRFIGALAHRGPDGEGVLLADDDTLALAHRRLAILDLSEAGAQPMRSPGGRYDITYNGEVYNFLELRAGLEAAGVRFRSDSDTEVILAAFERWGLDCLPRFNGMWSFALWDRQERRLLLCRDRFGVKPLYFARSAQRIAFASEMKAFLHLDGFEAAVDPAGLQARLADNYSDHLLLRGVESLSPGHCLQITKEGARLWRWWNTLDHLIRVPPDPADRAEEFRELFFDACRLRLRADVPLATSLSGGLDSSSVLCSLGPAQAGVRTTRRAPEWQRAYIAGFAGTGQDEVPCARLAVERSGAVPVIRPFTGEELSVQLDTFLYQYEDTGGFYGLAAWALYREMRREGVVISLDGHGGDELLGGYDLHVELALMRGPSFLAAPRRAWDLIQTLHGMYTPSEFQAPPGRIFLAALTSPLFRALGPRLPFAHGLRRLADQARRHGIYTARALDPAARAEAEAIEALGPLTGALYHSFHRHSLPRILRNFDLHSMGHGVEVRMPFLDWRVVRYAFSAPDESKVSQRYTKWLLREAMRDVLPEPLRLRRFKLGYNAPVSAWMSGPLGDWVWNELNDPEFLGSELWDGCALLRWVRAKRKSGAPWTSAEAHRVVRPVSIHWWLTRWLKGAAPRQQTVTPNPAQP